MRYRNRVIITELKRWKVQIKTSNRLHLPYTRIRFNGQFPGLSAVKCRMSNHPGFSASKHDGAGGCDNQACKASVTSPPRKYQHSFLKARCPSCRLTKSVTALKEDRLNILNYVLLLSNVYTYNLQFQSPWFSLHVLFLNTSHLFSQPGQFIPHCILLHYVAHVITYVYYTSHNARHASQQMQYSAQHRPEPWAEWNT